METTLETTGANSKRSKFVELANNRVNNALKAISLIGNLANKGSYDYSQEDVKKIFGALNAKVAEVQQRFTGTHSAKPTFQLTE